MLKFRLFGYPVRVEWMFWVICALLGLSGGSNGPEQIYILLLWTVAVFVSILWHELGHAWARKKCRQPYSEIVLHGMGGYCAGPGNFTRKEQMFISAAGPAASLLLGGAVYLLMFTPGMSNRWAGTFVSIMLFTNIGWALFNLLPILPMDGGRIFEAFMANRKPSIVPKVGFVIATILAVMGMLSGNLWIAFLMGFMAYGNWQRMQQGNFR